MKTRLVLFGFLLVNMALFAQSPESFKYQGVLRDESGNVKVNKTTTILLSIFQGSTTGSSIYSETHSVSTNQFGLVNLTVGAGTNPSGNFAAIDWSSGPYFLSVTVDGIVFGTSQLLSVPYALFSKRAANGFSGNYSDLLNKPNFATVAISGNYIDLSNAPDFSVYYTKTNLQTSGQAQVDASNISSGILNVAHGGTGATSLSGILVGNGTGALTSLTQTGGNQYLRSNAGNTNFEFGPLSTVAGSGDYNDLINIPTFLNSSNYSTATGLGTLQSNTGINNSAIGYQALYSNTTGNSNVANGYQALYSNISGVFNTANGGTALYSNTTGGTNSANGSNALFVNTTGSGNTANGFQALYSNTIGNDNTANGRSALYFNTSGNYNTANGILALYNNRTGIGNTSLGYEAGFGNYTGSGNTFLGYGADATASNLTNATAIGNLASVNVSNKIVIGNASATTVGGYGAWTNYSDRRLKENIVYTNSIGLNFITRLKPVTYNYIKDSNKRKRNGLIAQDVEEVLQELGISFSGLVIDDDKDKTLNLSYPELVIPLITAVQEQQKQIEELKRENAILIKESAQTKSEDNERLQKLEELVGVKVVSKK